MYDCHYDLLTYIYMNKNNLIKVKKHLNRIFKNNITGGIFNLFYMSPKEMKDELSINYSEINIIENLKTVNKLIKQNNLIPKEINYIYGIEGLDYLKKIRDIDEIYNLGVRSVNPVWNNDNKFGGGVKGNSNRGLTILGEELIRKLVDKRIAIDLSHANEKTFNDIIKVCTKLKHTGRQPIVLASHSNCKSICNIPRNLTDEQIVEIKKLDGIIGIVGVRSFCTNNILEGRVHSKMAYLEHIKHVKNILRGTTNISVSTDDMTYYKIKKNYYKHFNVFKQEKMKAQLENILLKNKFTKSEAENLLFNSFESKILQRL